MRKKIQKKKENKSQLKKETKMLEIDFQLKKIEIKKKNLSVVKNYLKIY